MAARFTMALRHLQVQTVVMAVLAAAVQEVELLGLVIPQAQHHPKEVTAAGQ